MALERWYTFKVRREFMRGYSPILISAALSVAVLIVAIGMHLGTTFSTTPTIVRADLVPVELPSYVPTEDADANGTPDWQDELARAGISLAPSLVATTSPSDPLSTIGADIAQILYGGYLSLKQYGEYSPSRGEQLGTTVASNLRAPIIFTPHVAQELSLDTDTSKERVLTYRSHMRDATASMITDEGPEFELFARYLSTKDASWLGKLQIAAARYREAEAAMLALTIPKDAAPEHLRVINAVGGYASTLERLSVFGDDALASAALLRTYNEAEQELLMSFDMLAQYYVRKITN